MSKRAFVDPKIIDSVKADKTLLLDESTAHRFLRVLRLNTGAPVELLDGTGRVAHGILQTQEPAHLTQVQVEVLAQNGPRIVLAQAMVKMDKLEQIVQRSTELGVSEILLFEAERSQVNFKDKSAQKLERLTRIAEDAARQSERSHTPAVSGPHTFAQLLKICADFQGLKVMGDLNATQTLPELLSQELCKRLLSKLACEDKLQEDLGAQNRNVLDIHEDSSTKSTQRFASEVELQKRSKQGVLVVVGPEGGLAPEELSKLANHEVQATLWNPNVLRTETAGMAAIAVIQGLR